MTVLLCVPHAPVPLSGGRAVARAGVTRLRLRWTDHHPLSHHGTGVLLDHKGGAFDGHTFRLWRERMGAWLEADDMDRARAALGLPAGERVGRE